MHRLHLIIKKNQQLFFFLAVGALTAVVYFSCFALIWQKLHFDYKTAVTIAYFLAVIFQFNANRHITFKSQHGHVAPQIIKFVTLLIINYIITLIIITSTVHILLLSPYLGMCLSIGATVISGFLLSKKWVFKLSYSN